MKVNVITPMGIRDHLAGHIPGDRLAHLSDHFDVIGDIAVLAVPPELAPYMSLIAETIVSHRKNIRTVLNRTGTVTGPERTAPYEIILGTTTETVHREFGFSYRLDVGRSFFSPRLARERKRVTGLVEPGERIYVPFAGVGPFAIPAAARGADVDAVELNPDAYRSLAANIVLNHVEPACHAVLGDALDISQLRHTRYDRLILPAPYGMDHMLDRLLPLLSEGGAAHFYTFRAKEQIPALAREYEERGLTVTGYAPCGNVAPGISRWVFDLVRP